MTLRDKMIVLRDKAGISQMALAEQLGVSRQAVTRWESGDRVVRVLRPAVPMWAVLRRPFLRFR